MLFLKEEELMFVIINEYIGIGFRFNGELEWYLGVG